MTEVPLNQVHRMPAEEEPAAVDVSMGGYMGPSYRVRGENGTLIYEAAEGMYDIRERAVVEPPKGPILSIDPPVISNGKSSENTS